MGFDRQRPVSRRRFAEVEGRELKNAVSEERGNPRAVACIGPHLTPIVEAAIHLGTRAGREILDIRCGDVLFEEGRVRIRRGKTGQVDFVRMNDDLAALFSRLIPPKVDPKAHVFLYERKPIKSVLRSFRTACRNAGIEDFRFHDLRHTCASHLIMNGANLKEVQDHLGHRNISTTNRYLHLTDEHKQKTANRTVGLTKISPKVSRLA